MFYRHTVYFLAMFNSKSKHFDYENIIFCTPELTFLDFFKIKSIILICGFSVAFDSVVI